MGELNPKMTRRTALAGLGVGAFAPRWAHAQGQKETIIGVLNDQSGPFARNGGPGSTTMAQIAVEEFGGSLFGKPVTVISADHQNKPDVASALAREWFSARGVSVILDGATSAAALAISDVARNAGKPFLTSGAATTELTGKQCSPMTLQFNYDTYMLANGAAKGLIKSGNDTWFLLVEDDAFGHALERDIRRFVGAAGGKVVGAISHPLDTSDFSSFILQAQSSQAKVVALCNAGVPFVNAVKQSAEFGLTTSGQKLGGILVNTSEIKELTLDVAKGLTSTESFYWDLDDKTRDLAKRYAARVRDNVPTAVQAGVYAATLHYLKAADKAGSTAGAAVMAAMKATPVNDAYNHDVLVRSDGRVMHEVYVFEVKSPTESKYPFDYYKVLAKLSGVEAYRPLAEGGCPLVTAG